MNTEAVSFYRSYLCPAEVPCSIEPPDGVASGDGNRALQSECDVNRLAEPLGPDSPHDDVLTITLSSHLTQFSVQ